MKKPFSIVDAALNVIRVCLAAGILITLFDFFTRIDQTPAIVIRFPKSAETEETSGYEPEYTAGTQIIQKSRGYKKPELLTEEPEPEISAIAENETEPIIINRICRKFCISTRKRICIIRVLCYMEIRTVLKCRRGCRTAEQTL